MHLLPSKGSKVVHKLPTKSKATVLKRAGLWFQVEPFATQDVKGWVRFSRLSMTGSTESTTAQAESPGALTGLARSATGLFGYTSRESSDTQSGATIGIRGLSASDLKVTSPDYEAQKRMEAARATSAQARAFAKPGGLGSSVVAYLKGSGGATSSTSSGGTSGSSTSGTGSGRSD
jgi:hypothetical protein